VERRQFTKEFKVEAVRLVRDRGVCVAQASRDLDVHENLLRKWIKDFEADPRQAFPGQGNMKPEQAEIERLRREVQKLKAERDILKVGEAETAMGWGPIARRTPTSPRTTRDVWVHCEAPGDLAGGFDLRGARCLAQRLLRVADA